VENLEKMSAADLRENAAFHPKQSGVVWLEAFDELANRYSVIARRLKEAEAREAGMTEALREIQWLDISTDLLSRCPDCSGTENTGHKETCRIGNALSLASPRAKQILAVVEAAKKWEKTCDTVSEEAASEVLEAVRALK
jgi:hypothetical protein